MEPLAIHGFMDAEKRITRALAGAALGSSLDLRYSHPISEGK